MSGDDAGPADEVPAALVASLRRELADALGVLEETRAELARARERIAELEADIAEFLQATVQRRAGQASFAAAGAAEENRAPARRPGWA